MKRELHLTNHVSEISRLSSFIEQIGEELSLPSPLVLKLNLALEEAVSNIIFYAFPKNEEHIFELRTESTNARLTFILVDDGIPFDPTLVPDVNLSTDDRKIGGLGIFLVRQLMDTVTYKRVGNQNVLILEKELY